MRETLLKLLEQQTANLHAAQGAVQMLQHILALPELNVVAEMTEEELSETLKSAGLTPDNNN